MKKKKIGQGINEACKLAWSSQSASLATQN